MEVVANFSGPAVTVLISVPFRIEDIVSTVFAERYVPQYVSCIISQKCPYQEGKSGA